MLLETVIGLEIHAELKTNTKIFPLSLEQNQMKIHAQFV